jgi:hypothetical protein
MEDIAIEVNSVFRRTLEDGIVVKERVIWVDDGNIFMFNIEAESGFPVLKKVNEIEAEIRSGLLAKEPDPWNKVIDEKSLGKKEVDIRDKGFEIIQSLITCEPDIYYRNKRGSLVQSATKSFGITVNTVNRYLRRYWQRGKCKNALLPDYDSCGALGKERVAGVKKRGRPRKFMSVLGEGKNVTPQDVVKFQKVLYDHHFIRNGLELSDTYDMLLKEHYYCDVRYDENGIKKTILKGSDEIPTYEQFRYWFSKNYSYEEIVRSRKGDRYFELHNRPILGSSTSEAFGPGFKYQMDSTVGDIYLVSRFRRSWIVGRPVIYVIIDVFSRMVVGVHISLEGPSWEQASIALANAMLDKVDYCSKYEIDIRNEEWPAQGIMSVLFGDRGELAGTMVESATNSLNFRIENAPPYRADWKGIVERYFRTINEKVKPFMPGSIQPDFAKRGGKDYRLDAKLDIQQFTRLVIKCLLKYNNYHYMPYYPLSKEMISEDIDPIPIELWKWGIEEFGKPSNRDVDYIKLSLMPRATAEITEHGIRFKRKLLYSCDRAIRESWFVRGNPTAPDKVNISYDPRNLNQIYIWEMGDRSYEVCSLLPYQTKFLDRNIYEIENYIENQELKRNLRQERERQEDDDLNAEIAHGVGEATEMTDRDHLNKESNRKRVKDIKKNRREEATIIREENRSVLGSQMNKKNHSSNKSKVVPISSAVSNLNDSLEFPSDINFLVLRQKEKQNDNNKPG